VCVCEGVKVLVCERGEVTRRSHMRT
jgi:hypothetical protein